MRSLRIWPRRWAFRSFKSEVEQLERQAAQEGFWDDLATSQKVLQKTKQAKHKIEKYSVSYAKWEDACTLVQLALRRGDDDMLDEVIAEHDAVAQQLEDMRLSTLLTGEYDSLNVILAFHPGAGGTEAQDWRRCSTACIPGGPSATTSPIRFLTISTARRRVSNRPPLPSVERMPMAISRARWECIAWCACRPLTRPGVDIPPLPRSRSCRSSTTPLRLTFATRISRWTPTARAAPAASTSTRPSPPSASRTSPPAIVVACQNERSQHQNRETAMTMLKSKLLELKERERVERIEDIKGDQKDIAWGSQIRSYVFMPYTLVKDHRTGFESGNIGAVMDGDIDGFINAYLKAKSRGEL